MNEIEKIKAGLVSKASKGAAIRQMMETKGFKEVYEPWIQKTLSNYEKNGLIGVSKMTNDEIRVFAGEYRGAKIVHNFFSKAVKEGDKASERLKEIEGGK